MGIRELSEVFAQAGARFADLPEFLEEQAEWAQLTPPIEMFPNSRFGIGVLSYFMLADEITISTCRLGRDGRPGRLLLVSIAGPGNLFRVVDLGGGDVAGTSVRLHLRTDQEVISCAAVLREVLWAAEFGTRVQDATGTAYWEPGVLAANPAADPDDDESRSSRPAVVSCSDAPVWWTSTGGRILTDGIATDRRVAGAVIDLRGQFSPALSVNRRSIVGNRPASVEGLLEQALPELLRNPDGIVTWQWLCNLAQDVPRVADRIAQHAITAGSTWRIGDATYSASAIGCFAADSALLSVDEGRSGLSKVFSELPDLPEEIAAWRATALGCSIDCAGLPVIPALPSDLILLTYHLEEWLDPAAPAPLGHLIAAALKLRRPIQAVADRLAELGYRTPDVSTLPSELSLEDLVLVDRQLGAQIFYRSEPGRWLDEPPSWLNPRGSSRASNRDYLGQDKGNRDYLGQDERVPLCHVIGAAVALRRTATEVTERLVSLGYHVRDASRLPADLIAEDFYLVHDYPGGAAFWPEFERHAYLDPDKAVPLGHVLRAALQWGWGTSQVADRLRALGFGVPDVSGLPDDLTWDDVDLVDGVVDREPAWLGTEVPVPVRHVLREAARREVSVVAVSARLAELGFVVPDMSHVTSDSLPLDDVALLDEVYGGTGTGQEPPEPVFEGHVLRIAAMVGRDPELVRRRLSDLGCRVPRTIESANLGQDDAALVRDEHSLLGRLGREVWLDIDEPVSLDHVLHAAVRLGRRPPQIAARLRRLGYEVPPVPEGPADLSEADLRLSDDASGRGDGELDVPLTGLIRAAAERLRPASEVAERLALLGFTVPDTTSMPDALTRDDIVLTENQIGDQRWLDPAVPVTIAHVMLAAEEISRDAAYAASRLAELGYRKPRCLRHPPGATWH